MELRPYVVEQHFGSGLVDIEVEIGFMETRLKKNKMKEKRSQTELLLLVLYFLSSSIEHEGTRTFSNVWEFL